MKEDDPHESTGHGKRLWFVGPPNLVDCGGDEVVFAFEVFLQRPDLALIAAQYEWLTNWVEYSLSLLDFIYMWMVFGDGLEWCPTYPAVLEATLAITTNWLINDREGLNVYLDDHTPDDRPLVPIVPPHRRARMTLPKSGPIPFADERFKLHPLISERTFERLRAAKAAGVNFHQRY